jgi:hypothetical protein
VAVIWVFFVANVNRKYQETRSTVCPRGSFAAYDGILYSIVDCKWLDDGEVRTHMQDEGLSDCEYKGMVVELQITNTTDETKEYSLYECCMEGPGYTNGLCADFIVDHPEDNQLHGELAPQESRTVQMPYLCADTMFRKKTWEHLENQEFGLIVSLYPDKVKLLTE